MVIHSYNCVYCVKLCNQYFALTIQHLICLLLAHESDDCVVCVVREKQHKKKISYFTSHLILFCSLAKGIIMKICRLCVCVQINKRSFEPFMYLEL